MLIIELLNKISYTSKTIIDHFLHRGGFDFNGNFTVWFVIAALTVFVLILGMFIKNKNLLSFLLVIIVSTDIGFFSLTSIQYAFKDVSAIQIAPISADMVNNRIVSTNTNLLYGNTHLYLPSWSLFGYSGPFETKIYSQYLTSLGFASQRKTGFDINIKNPDLDVVKNLKNLGVTRIYDDTFNFYDVPLDKNNIDLLIPKNTTSSYIVKKEGYLQFKLNNKATVPFVMQTLVRSYPGWEIFVDGVRTDIIDDQTPQSKVYLQFLAPSGEHTITMRYVPKDLIFGVLLSALMIPMIYPVSKLLKNLKEKNA